MRDSVKNESASTISAKLRQSPPLLPCWYHYHIVATIPTATIGLVEHTTIVAIAANTACQIYCHRLRHYSSADTSFFGTSVISVTPVILVIRLFYYFRCFQQNLFFFFLSQQRQSLLFHKHFVKSWSHLISEMDYRKLISDVAILFSFPEPRVWFPTFSTDSQVSRL